MEELAYKLKKYFSSDKFLRFKDKFFKVFKRIVPKIGIYLVLIAFSYIFMYPIIRVFVDSLKTKDDLLNPDIVWIPSVLTGKNYTSAAKALMIYEQDSSSLAISSTLLNSSLYALLSALFQTFVACTAGYAFARFNFSGKKAWFAGLIMGFIVPTQLLTLPRSMFLRNIMNNTGDFSQIFGIESTSANANQVAQLNATFSVFTRIPSLILTLLGQGINSSILVFIAFSFFKMIPVALDEAAQIDGANFFQIFYHIILKMSLPTILVVFLFAFIWNWNDTYSVYCLTNPNAYNTYQSLPYALNQFNYHVSQDINKYVSKKDNESNNAGLQSAAIIISIAPLLILYAFTQRKFVEGIENTGVTGV